MKILSTPKQSFFFKVSLFIFIATFLVSISTFSLLITFSSYNTLKESIHLIDPDRSIRFLSFWVLYLFKIVTGLISITSIILLIFLYMIRDSVIRVVSSFFKDARMFLSNIYKETKEWFAEEYLRSVPALFLFIIIGTGIRLAFLSQPVSYDEAITFVYFGSRTLLDVVTDYSIPNNQIFHTVLVKLSTMIGGIEPLIMRLPAFLAGLLIIPFSYWLMRRLFNNATALITAGISSLSPVAVEYSTQARGYTIIWLCFLIGFILATYLRENQSRIGWALFIMVFSIGFYTIPIMLYPFAIVILWMLLEAAKEMRTKLIVKLSFAFFFVVFITTILYLPVMIRYKWNGIKSLVHNPWILPLSIPEFITKNINNWHIIVKSWVCDLPIPAIVFLILGFSISLLTILDSNDKKVKNVLLSCIFGPLPFIILQRVAPPPRAINFLIFIFLGIASFGLVKMFERVRIFNNRTIFNVLIILVFVGTAYWGSVQLLKRLPTTDSSGVQWVGTNIPGTKGINCCTEGYFTDAETIIKDMKPLLRSGDVLIAHQFSGAVETLRYYLLKKGLSPNLVYPSGKYNHPYSKNSLQQLYQYNNLYIVVTKFDNEWAPDNIYEILNCSKSAFDKLFYKPELVANYRVSDLFRLRWKMPVDKIKPNDSLNKDNYIYRVGTPGFEYPL